MRRVSTDTRPHNVDHWVRCKELLNATLSSLGSEDRVSVRGCGVRVQGKWHAVSENAGC